MIEVGTYRMRNGKEGVVDYIMPGQGDLPWPAVGYIIIDGEKKRHFWSAEGKSSDHGDHEFDLMTHLLTAAPLAPQVLRNEKEIIFSLPELPSASDSTTIIFSEEAQAFAEEADINIFPPPFTPPISPAAQVERDMKTLRDEFAKAALQGFLACSRIHEISGEELRHAFKDTATISYEMADAMLEARKK